MSDAAKLYAVVREMLENLLAVCDANECADWKVGFIRAAVRSALKELGE